ncbi:MAG: hypothetical protein PGN25_16510 [Methylorubrum populi]
MTAARSSALKRFADGIENAIALPWSTGPAEGQISRLKDDQASDVRSGWLRDAAEARPRRRLSRHAK